MNEIFYLEQDEEITSVVDKLKGLEAKSVGLVAPKGSSIVQSLVSLKLLQKQAKSLSKEIAIITLDEVGQNLASRIELPVYADVRSKKPIERVEQKEPAVKGPIEITDEPAGAEEVAAAKLAQEAEKETEKAQEKAKEGVKAAAEEEYENLPDSFEVHRYDEPDNEQAQQKDEPTGEQGQQEDKGSGGTATTSGETEFAKAEKDEQKDESKDKKSTPKPEADTPGFVNRPLREKKEDNRMDLESARPTILEKKHTTSGVKKKSKLKTVLIVVGIVVLIVALGLADLTLARLNIDVVISAEPITKEVTIYAQKDHPNIDFDGGVIGATQTEKEISKNSSYGSTGEKETGDPAKGTLTIQNELGTNVSLTAGTTIRSSDGVSFTLDSSITVPKATLDAEGHKVLGKTTGSVTAAQAGSSGNMSSGTSYVAEGKNGISLVGSTSGGTSRKVKVVTTSDIDALKEDLMGKATDQFKEDLKSNADVVFLDGAYTAEVTSFTTSKNAGDVADNFTGTAKVRVVALTFSKKDFNQAVVKIAEKDLPEGKSLLVTEMDQATPSLDEAQLNIGKLKLKGELRSHVGPKIDLEQMIANFKFKPIKKVRAEIEAIPGATVKEVSLSPSYALPLGPILKSHTKFNIEYKNK